MAETFLGECVVHIVSSQTLNRLLGVDYGQQYYRFAYSQGFDDLHILWLDGLIPSCVINS